jgi:hypothetical protein
MVVSYSSRVVVSFIMTHVWLVSPMEDRSGGTFGI